MESQRKGMLLVVSGPSGVGKGTLLVNGCRISGIA